MPELAEVEHSRRQWDPGLGEPIREVFITRPSLRIFRDTDTRYFSNKALPGQKLIQSEARGKQMLFQFSGDLWLGIHLGMNGELRRESLPGLRTPQTRSPRAASRPPRARLRGQTPLRPRAPAPGTDTARLVDLPRARRAHAGSSPSLPPQNSSSADAVRPSRPSCSCRNISRASATGWPTKSSGAPDSIPRPRPVRSTPAQVHGSLGSGPLGQPHRHPHHQRRLDLPAHLAVRPSLGGRGQVPPLPRRPGPRHRRRPDHLLVP